MVVVGVLFITVASVWYGTRKDFVNPKGEGGRSLDPPGRIFD
jgi:alpha-1,3-mannosyltransferase